MTKRIAILKSNYIAWKGYFDLINMVDEFILFDDAQYTKNDWLAQYLFDSIEEVQEYATRWLWTYNHERPNMGLGGITPIQKLAMVA